MGRTALRDSLRGAEAEIAAGHPEQALARVQEVQARYPRALPVQRVLGEVYLALRKSREALGSLDRALAGNPEDARACCARSIVNQIQGDTLAALAWYRRACDLSPDDKMLRAAYRELAANLGQPPYAPSRMGLARLYLRGDLFAHAIREFETLVAEQSDALEAQVGLAESLWRADQFVAATEWCRRLLANAPSCVKALLILAVIEHDAGHVDEAQRLLRRACELDPDQQIAQTLFADRLDSGDGALRTLLFGEDAPAATVPTDQAAALANGRPSVHSLPLNGAGAEPATERLTTPTVPPLRTGPLTQSSVSTAARTSALPPDFHTIFAETEYMLWGHDESGNPGTPAGYQERTRTDTFAHSAVVVPPALREQGGGFDDTESRVAINWINWLQALGARPLDGRAGRPGTGPLTGPIASSTPPWSGHTGPLVLPPIQTGPLPPPTPEALRRMFAELEPEAVSRRVVDGNIVEASSAASDAQSDILDGERDAERAWSDSQASAEGWTLDSSLPAEMRQLRDFEAAPATLASDPISDSEHDAVDYGDAPPVATLESLEKGFTASGFSNMELRPGELAALTGHPTPLAADDHAPSIFSGPLGDTGSLDTGSAYAAPASPPEPEPARADDEPEPSDYAGRLDRARGRRVNGQLEDALGEYRVILKNAPDLLAEIVSELQESMMAAPENPEVHRLLGDARIREGDYLSALESYNRAVALTQAQGM